MKKMPVLVGAQSAIKLAGSVVIISYCVVHGGTEFVQHWFIALIVIALEAASVAMPYSINHHGNRAVFTADQMVVVAAALLLPTYVAIPLIPLGYLLGCAITREFFLSRVDDSLGYVLGAALSLYVAHLIGPVGLSWNSIVGAIVAGLIYDPFTLFLLTATLVIIGQARFWKFFWTTMPSTLITYPWLISLGVLIGVVGWDAPWALPLMGAPLALVFMASRSRVEATEDRTRLDGLLKATTEILAATTIAAVTDSVESSVAELFETSKGRISVEGPGEGELAAVLPCELIEARYLVVPTRQTLVRPYNADDQRLLETLASVTASALDKAAAHEDVTEQATRDALTGLVNRRAFENELQNSMIGHRSTDASGIMFLDLDGFKKINDEHGHKSGDEVLIETAKRLLESVRGGDTVARLGGDEFTVLLRGVHTKEEAAVVAERILTAMRRPIRLSSGADVHPTPSLGIALANGPAQDRAALLKEADAAMYEAKRAGKDCWRLAPAVASLNP